uniref:Uncharacterized protein n=1 Tax=uncultured organism TaxID=155900 RepID=A0A7L9QBS8_9ZZZZ|nr:hypothetical protein [uncultured organism]
MTTGVLYDAAFVPTAAIVARKPTAMSLYTDGGHATPLSTVQAFRKAGIPIWPNHENAANELLGGGSAGTAAAQHAVAAVCSWGVPTNGTVDIVYSVDVNTPATEFPTIGAAFGAINAVHAGRFNAKCYGEGALIDYLVTHGFIKPGNWLSASSSFPGYNINDGNVAVWQQVGTDIAGTDRDVITHLELMGLWMPDGLTFEGSGQLVTAAPAPTEEVDDMANNMIMYAVDTASTPAGATDGGVWIDYPNSGIYYHVDGTVPSVNNVAAYQAMGAAGPVTISYPEHQSKKAASINGGSKPTIVVNGVAVDPAVIAKAVNDDAATRLAN